MTGCAYPGPAFCHQDPICNTCPILPQATPAPATDQGLYNKKGFEMSFASLYPRITRTRRIEDLSGVWDFQFDPERQGISQG